MVLCYGLLFCEQLDKWRMLGEFSGRHFLTLF